MNNDEIKLKVMAYLDGELSELEMKEIKRLIDDDEMHKDVYLSLKKVKEVTQEMKFIKLPEMYWDDYWE
ncbi:MAG: hypothetical protein GQ561_00600, partial [Calditrichae bacterium]|nr:hypothetical protein [Calditrichia bacterium]